MQDAWAAGARLGYLVAPNVLSYVNGGYSGSHWSGYDFVNTFSGFAGGAHTNSFNQNGWFVGGGVENNLNIFGISAPGWFMKTEYRAAYYNKHNINELTDGTNVRPSVTTSTSTPGYRPSTPRWSTASTGAARWLQNTDLLPGFRSLESPGFGRGFFVVSDAYQDGASVARLRPHLSSATVALASRFPKPVCDLWRRQSTGRR